MTPTRRALLAAGVATVAVSLVLSIAPVIAANGNGNGGDGGNGGNGGSPNAGTIKIHDVTTGLETAENDTDPHVCAFWVAFYATDPFEAGTWQLLSWAPTGDGSVVASGTYDTAGDGFDSTGTLDPVAGHYRFEWGSTGSSNSKHKTLWVDETCGTDETPPNEDETPANEDETPANEDETPANEDETPPNEEEDETPPSENSVPPSNEEEDETPPNEEEDETRPSNDQTPPSDQNGESGILAGTGTPVVENPAPEGAVATGGAVTTLPDTSIPTGSSGVLAALGLLFLIVGAHAGTRRRPLRA
jgi:protein DEK